MATALITEATRFAMEQHGDQRYGRKPYHVHLADVVNVLRRFIDWDELPQEFIDAAWLHDVVEDTGATKEQVEVIFGPRVAQLVYAVTNEPGANRKERHGLTYPKIRAADGAIIIKLADRIANIEQTISHDRFGRPPQKMFSMYDREWDGFRTALGMGACANSKWLEAETLMWDYLEELMAEGRGKVEALKGLQTFRGEV